MVEDFRVIIIVEAHETLRVRFQVVASVKVVVLGGELLIWRREQFSLHLADGSFLGHELFVVVFKTA